MSRRLPGLLVMLLAACWRTEAPVEPVASWVPSADPDHIIAMPAAPAGVPVILQFNGVGTMYRNWFADRELVAALSEALAPCMEDAATVSVSYEEETRVGRVALVLPASNLRCRATPAGEGLDLTPLTPMAAALATYRNALGATRDMRIYAFRTALHVEDGFGSTTLWLDGQDPIDGSAFSRCPSLDGFEACVGEATTLSQGIVKVALPTPHQRRRLVTLLGPRPQ